MSGYDDSDQPAAAYSAAVAGCQAPEGLQLGHRQPRAVVAKHVLIAVLGSRVRALHINGDIRPRQHLQQLVVC